MTAFIVLKYADRVEMLADGAVYSEDGTLTDIRRKIVAGRSLAVMTRGNADAGLLFGQAVAIHSEVSGFDETMEWLAGKLAERSGTEPEFGFELITAGISETRGPVIHYATTNAYMDGVPAWTLIDAGSDLGGGGNVELEPKDFADSLVPAGIAAMDAMRQLPGTNPVKPDLPAVFGIGGQIDHAVVREGIVSVQTVHVWPDEIGRKINPRL